MLRKVLYRAAASHPSEGQQLSLVGGFLKYAPLLPVAPGAGERIASGSGLGATASSSGAFPCAPIARLSPVVPALGLASGFVLPPRGRSVYKQKLIFIKLESMARDERT
jgi:hypothetical protein